MKLPASSILLRFVLPFVIAVAAAFALRSAVTFYIVPSSSMEPTLYPGETIVVRRYREREIRMPRRGEVVVFSLPQDQPAFYVKRVVAIAGDHIEIVRGEVHVNGQRIDDSYVSWRDESTVAAQIVPREMIFVLGDRRTNSLDSRAWGPLPASLVVGGARRIFWSFDERADRGYGHRLRFDRIGMRIR